MKIIIVSGPCHGKTQEKNEDNVGIDKGSEIRGCASPISTRGDVVVNHWDVVVKIFGNDEKITWKGENQEGFTFTLLSLFLLSELSHIYM